MSYVCAICVDFLTPEEGEDNGGPPNPVVTTICGHVYHQKCILDWFESNKPRNNAREENHGPQLDNTTICPTCRKPTRSKELIRLFPSEEIEINGQMASSMDTAPKTRARLSAENKDLREKLKQMENAQMEIQKNWFTLLQETRAENDDIVKDLRSQLESSKLRSRGNIPCQPKAAAEEGTSDDRTPIYPVQRPRIIRRSVSVKPSVRPLWRNK